MKIKHYELFRTKTSRFQENRLYVTITYLSHCIAMATPIAIKLTSAETSLLLAKGRGCSRQFISNSDLIGVQAQKVSPLRNPDGIH